MSGRRRVEHCGRLETKSVSLKATSSRERRELVAMVSNRVLSREYDMASATATTTEEKGDRTVGSLLEVRRNECSLLSLRLVLELRTVREENAALAGAVNDRKVRVKT